MTNAKRDGNHVPGALGVSSTDGITVLPFLVDPITGRLLTDNAGGTGTVTSISVVTANGFAGTVATATTTPAITLTTTITGILKGNGTAISAAIVGTDYVTASSTNTFTNKTYDTAGTGNAFAINGTSITAVTGTGSVVLATSATLVSPALGTPTALVGTNITGTAAALSIGGNAATSTSATSATTATNLAGGSGGTIPYQSAAGTTAMLANGSAGQVLQSNGTTLAPSWAASPAASLTVGSTSISSGTTTRILYNNAGTLGEYTLTGTGTVVVMQGTPTLTTPVLGVATATSINKVAITAPGTSATLTIADGKTVTHNATTTFAGTDGKTLTISNSGTLSGGDAFVLAIAASKTFTVSNTLTLAGTDSTTITFPTTSATIARTDAANTFTGASTASAWVLTSPTITTKISPTTDDGAPLGDTTHNFSDLFLASGALINIANGNWVATHTSGILTVTTGDLRVTSANVGTNGDSVPTLSSTNTLTNKTLTSPTLTTPVLGTPSSGTLTSCTGLPAAAVVAGTLGSGTFTTTRLNFTNNAITASSNAATVPITSSLSSVTNDSAGNMTITMTTTSAVDGQMTIVRIYDFSAVAKTITWVNTENSTVTVPATSNGSTTLPVTIGFQYNSGSSKWRCIASA